MSSQDKVREILKKLISKRLNQSLQNSMIDQALSQLSALDKIDEGKLYCLSCGKEAEDWRVIKIHANCGGTLTNKKPDIGMTRYE